MVDRRASKGRRLRYDVQVHHLDLFLAKQKQGSVYALLGIAEFC